MEKINENNIEENSIDESKIKNSEIEESKINDSNIENSDIKDSEIISSNIEDSKIRDSKIIGEDISGRKNDLKDRKENLIKFFKTKQIWVFVFLIIALILGIYIRSLPMQDHGGNPGLWDITTNSWTLGPDLDPWLFTRYAKTIIKEGRLPEKDMMRNIPLGFDTSKETLLLPYLIVFTHKVLNIFVNEDVIFSAVIFPVIMFALTILSYFFFVREIFIGKSMESKIRANFISLISTFFMIVIPIFLSRTIAGIPEKESAAFFFLFLALFLFLKAWKSEKMSFAIVFAVLVGITTSLMNLIWGGTLYLYITIATATLIAFLVNKVRKKEFVIYILWIITSIPIVLIFSNKYDFKWAISSIDTSLALLVFFIMIIHFLVWKTKISNLNILKNSKIPKTIISIILAFIFLIILASIIFGPSFIINKIKAVHQAAFRPVVGRWNTTVAENRQPYFTDWVGNFGPYIRNIPIFFWLFFIGSITLFKETLNKIKKKDSWILTSLFFLLLSGLMFSRYSGSSILNGDNFLSKLFFYGSVFLFIGFFIYYYIKDYQKGNRSFKTMKFNYLILLSLYFVTVFTVRGAVRLIMTLGPIASIFVGYLIVKSSNEFRKTKEETLKIILGVLMIIILISSFYSFFVFYPSIKSQANNFIPSHYNQQWQKAMNWVREETPEDAVFGHWWDYGYWLQSIGERATVLDGGNAISFWNYYMGRFVLTGDNEKDALEFLYNHETDYLLIDSTDISKYGAFSSIGSNEDYDRYSWFGTFAIDEKNTQETNNQTLLFYTGGISLDEDLIIKENNREILLPRTKAGVGAIIIPASNNTEEFGQPFVIMVYNGKQYKKEIRYLYMAGASEGEGYMMDFQSGIEACAFVIPSVIQDGSGIKVNPFGAILYISPRLMRGLFSQVYLLKNSFGNFDNFELVHTEPSFVVDSLRNQGMNLPDFIYFQGIQGPIKIWEIHYTGEEKLREDYLDTDPTKYLSWRL